jgi:hypothetical protein
MLNAPLSPTWIVAVYLPARIVAVWGQGPTPNSHHEVIYDRQKHKYITSPTSPSCKVAEKCAPAADEFELDRPRNPLSVPDRT